VKHPHLTSEQYSEFCSITARYPRSTDYQEVTYLTMALAGEAGEVANELKKGLRDDGFNIGTPLTECRRERLLLELGDVEWYATRLAAVLGLSKSGVQQMNTDKLSMRIHEDAAASKPGMSELWQRVREWRLLNGLWVP
jgi:NTP pyrophosphatase (non-canonical NTP hydrolase)